MHRFAQRADALAVNDAHVQDALVAAGREIIWHESFKIARMKCMQIECAVNRHVDRVWFVHEFSF